jgi:hypothetical protein
MTPIVEWPSLSLAPLIFDAELFDLLTYVKAMPVAFNCAAHDVDDTMEQVIQGAWKYFPCNGI